MLKNLFFLVLIIFSVNVFADAVPTAETTVPERKLTYSVTAERALSTRSLDRVREKIRAEEEKIARLEKEIRDLEYDTSLSTDDRRKARKHYEKIIARSRSYIKALQSEEAWLVADLKDLDRQEKQARTE